MKKSSGYQKLAQTGELSKRAEKAYQLLQSCCLCPHMCAVDRLQGDVGRCRTSEKARVSSYGPHFGEEPPLVGDGGSGTIFFSYCNLQCVFCQNYEISHLGHGKEVANNQLAAMMLELQQRGCENINLVTPTHVMPQALAALAAAADKGLKLPLVYNSGGYENESMLRLLDGVVDIYLPDTKFACDEKARLYCGAGDYPDKMLRSLREMYRQVGNLETDSRGVATRGLMVRHLFMPGGLADTEKLLKFIAAELSKDTYINIMSQYYPSYKAAQFPELNKHVSKSELNRAVQLAGALGLKNVRT